MRMYSFGGTPEAQLPAQGRVLSAAQTAFHIRDVLFLHFARAVGVMFIRLSLRVDILSVSLSLFPEYRRRLNLVQYPL